MSIHPSAIVSPAARLHPSAQIGPFTIIHGDVGIEENVIIGPYCEIGVPAAHAPTTSSGLTIRGGSRIRSHTVLYAGSSFEGALTTGHHVTIRERTRAGQDLKVGSYGDIQGDCQFGDYVRVHSQVFIPQLSRIGNFVWMFPGVTLTNDSRPPCDDWSGVVVGDYAIIAARALILPGRAIGREALVAAGAVITKDVPDGTVWAGNPARQTGMTHDLRVSNHDQEKAYPWRYRFFRSYPQDIVAAWQREAEGDVGFTEKPPTPR
ncbi:MAG TPA: hypothetical protein VHL08_10240 [Dongiaceae bacterium]|jgi:acyl-[acyl carrier protein]--UDP-N-acetylglucosamine O-acyltransferase|nr:hypothetical protein [Dongiaceae bacterium]